MKEKNDIFDHLKPRKNSVPDASYFEALANSVIDSQKEKGTETNKKTKVIPLYKRPSVWIGSVAAIFIAGILVVNFSKTTETETDPILALNNVSSGEVYDYIDENIEDFDTDLFVEALNESAVDDIAFIESKESKSTHEEIKIINSEPVSFEQIDSDDILDYFNEEGIDMEDLDDDSFI